MTASADIQFGAHNTDPNLKTAIISPNSKGKGGRLVVESELPNLNAPKHWPLARIA